MTPSTTRDGATEARPTATVVPLSRAGGRRFRREAEAAEPRGQILLFTGVRYERMPESDAEPDAEPTIPQRRRS